MLILKKAVKKTEKKIEEIQNADCKIEIDEINLSICFRC